MPTILLISAEGRFRAVLTRVLTGYRHRVLATSSVQEGSAMGVADPPDLVLFDLERGADSSLAELATLRARVPQVPVIAVSDGLSFAAESRARELGVRALLRKGLKLDVIMETVGLALKEVGPNGRTALPPAPSHAAGATAQEAGRILVVDDEVEIRELLQEFLAQRGYRTDGAANGAEALTKIQSRPPDLVILDVYMPEMNGVDVLRRLKDPRRAASSPVGVIMLTASQDEALLREALDLGAFDVLPKPVDLSQVELAVQIKMVLGE